jgi:hypothetical protein
MKMLVGQDQKILIMKLYDIIFNTFRIYITV